MIIFICGGSKSGKSSLAQDISKAMANGNPLYYIATMIPFDEEDREKIRLHIEDRAGMGFETVECGRNLLSVVNITDTNGTFMLDSITALLTNEMYGNFDENGVDKESAHRVIKDIKQFADSVNNLVIVSDYIFSDAESYDLDTQLFRSFLAHINNKTAALADVVVEMSFGNITVHKGTEFYEKIF